ncbi:ABC transporter transmembrane domain-containing protein [Aurantimonas sp. HBX-1]|uniref:ABC transporter transmembrane domain-containing protein n=1 Tax=Aurantimonas sp. HBX-1 TaxID=2906072 RepID=UPI001EFEF9ED|nr:ABC transporter transmembrane domain-containing protein [Aurantimonas sp. HBX-1]UIJ72557.1 ABC transporter ATP-binding protein [Aurantimonas sp. HBX-1]
MRNLAEASPGMSDPGGTVAAPLPGEVVALAVPRNLSGLIFHSGWREQIVLVVLSGAVFMVNILPLELQRRIVNDATEGVDWIRIAWLAVFYALLAIALGLLKLGMNIYRGRTSESAVRWLRAAILGDIGHFRDGVRRPLPPGVEVSLVLSEAEPIGSFVGVSISEPLLQGGLLLSVFGYLTYLNPLMALVAAAVFSPQIVFVPLMQNAINRRVGRRIATLRTLSIEIVDAPVDARQAERSYDREIGDVFALNMGIFKLKYSMNFAMNLFHHLGVAAVLGVGGYFVAHGETEIGTVVAFISGLAQVNGPWGDLVDWYRELRVTQTKYGLITQVLATLTPPAPNPV